MDNPAKLVSLKKVEQNQYEAMFIHDGNECIKRFEVLENDGREEISVDDRDLEPRLILSDNVKRALFAFHRSFKEPTRVEKEGFTYLAWLHSPENLARIEKMKASLLKQMLDQYSPEELKNSVKMSRERFAKDEKYGKKILTDPDADIVYRELT